MKVKISYHSIPYGGSIFATPKESRVEHVEAKSMKELYTYIKKQKDDYGHAFTKNPDYGKKNDFVQRYDFLSKQGGCIITFHKNIQFKKI